MKALILIVALTSSVYSQIAKKDTVVLKFSEGAATFEKYKAWQAKAQYVINVGQSGDAITLDGDPKWQEKAFPEMVEYTVREINPQKKKPSEVFLVSLKDWTRQIKILIASELDLQKALSAVLFKGSATDFLRSDYFATLEASFLPKIFKGSLSTFTPEQQRKLFAWVGFDINGLTEASFKDKIYFGAVIDDGVVYNTNQLNQAERAARQTESALKKLREMYKITGMAAGFDGVKISADIFFRDFVDEKVNQKERFEIYVSFNTLKNFMDADITNQELVDSSTILVDGSRVKVNLTNFS
jgi:hypothetical protein